VTGEHIYIQNVRIPGMLHGRVVRPPVINTEPENIDSAARNIPGFVKVVREVNLSGGGENRVGGDQSAPKVTVDRPRKCRDTGRPRLSS
jgi:hypothetical protein